MTDLKPTLKEYLTTYQITKNAKLGLSASNVSFISGQERSRKVIEKLENIRKILK